MAGSSWAIHTGDASYDTDHNGFWGAGELTKDTNLKELAADLIDQAEDDHDGADIERSETSAATHQAAAPHMYECFLFSDDAEASVLVSAKSRKEAREEAIRRVQDKEVAWEGQPADTFGIGKIVDLGIDEGQKGASTRQAAKKSAQEIADMLISTIEAVGVEKDDQGYTVPSSDPEWIDLGEAYEKAKRGQIVQAIVALVSTIKETGGVEQDAKGYTVPVADPEWIDLGIVYDAAVAYMSKSKSKA